MTSKNDRPIALRLGKPDNFKEECFCNIYAAYASPFHPKQKVIVEQHTSGESVDTKGYLKKQDLHHQGRFRPAWQFVYINNGRNIKNESRINLSEGKLVDLIIDVSDFITFKAKK